MLIRMCQRRELIRMIAMDGLPDDIGAKAHPAAYVIVSTLACMSEMKGLHLAVGFVLNFLQD